MSLEMTDERPANAMRMRASFRRAADVRDDMYGVYRYCLNEYGDGVGFVALNPAWDGSVVEVVGVYVVARRRRQGIARFMVAQASREFDCPAVVVDTVTAGGRALAASVERRPS